MRGRVFPVLLALGALSMPAMACPPSDEAREEIIRAVEAQARAQNASPVVDTSDVWLALALLTLVFAASLIVMIAANVDARRSLRHRLSRAATGLEPIELALVTKLARDTLMRACVLAMAALGGAWLVFATMPPDALMPHALLFAPSIAVWVRTIAATQRAGLILSRLHAPHVTAGYDGSRFVFVLERDQLVGWLVAWPTTLQRVRSRGIPAARVRS